MRRVLRSRLDLSDKGATARRLTASLGAIMGQLQQLSMRGPHTVSLLECALAGNSLGDTGISALLSALEVPAMLACAS